MLPAIHLDNQPPAKTSEIGDVVGTSRPPPLTPIRARLASHFPFARALAREKGKRGECGEINLARMPLTPPRKGYGIHTSC